MQQLNHNCRNSPLTVAFLDNGNVAILPNNVFKCFVDYFEDVQGVFDHLGVTFFQEGMPKEEYLYQRQIQNYKDKPLLKKWLYSQQIGGV